MQIIPCNIKTKRCVNLMLQSLLLYTILFQYLTKLRVRIEKVLRRQRYLRHKKLQMLRETFPSNYIL